MGESLKKFIGKKNTQNIAEQIKMKTQELLLKQNAIMNGAEPDSIKVNTLWRTFTIKQKALWFYYNKLTKIGAKKRAAIDQINEKNLEQNYLEDYEGWEWEDYFDLIQYPDLYQLSPKSIMRVDFKIRPAQPLEFIGLELQIEDIQKKS